ncbi:MAG: SPOR domain-containing protein [Novosphingobium sp.]
MALAQADDDPDGPATVSRPVVQSTTPSASRELNSALARLAADPRNVTALFDAADAALKLGDSDAAIGFLTRADEVQSGNARGKALIGKAYLVAENPVDAVRAFDEAERAGGDTFAMAEDRALAYDLVGDNARAQRWYQAALSRSANPETTRRYAMSLAISGDRRGAEALLAPLIEKQDRAAWRTRTFAMAVTGGPDEAVAIAYASMPQDLAANIAPYLRYMPRLTPAQQAAAANFGRFPRAADIGRDDPRVVQYAALNPRAPRSAEAGLIPTGAPLGPSAASSDKPSREKRRRPGRIETARVTPAPTTTASPSIASGVSATTTPGRMAVGSVSATPVPAPVQAASTGYAAQAAPATQPPRPTVLSALDVPPGTSRPPVPQIRAATTRPQVTTPAPTTSYAPATAYAASTQTRPGSTPAPLTTPTPTTTYASAPATSQIALPPASAAPTPAQQARVAVTLDPETSGPGSTVDSSDQEPTDSPAADHPVDDARAAANSTVTAQPMPTPAATLTPAPAPAPVAATPAPVQQASAASAAPPDPPRPADFASMFKTFTPPPEERTAPVVAVDVTRLPPKAAPRTTPVKADPRGERPDGPTEVSRTPAKEPEKPAAKDTKATEAKSAKDAKAKAAEAAKEAKDAKAKKAAPSHPSRIWVQVLTGGNKDVMDNEWRRLVKEAPELLRSRKPYLSPWRSNFRLLTGPFETEAAAQDFVTKLKKSGVSSYQWTSPAGQPVDTLALK